MKRQKSGSRGAAGAPMKRMSNNRLAKDLRTRSLVSMASKFNELRGQVGSRVWYETGDAFAFVVHAPLTFGHSQLVVRVRSGSSEENTFERASLHIASCICALRTKLPTGSRRTWKELISYTGTTGKYQKTLVLKTSADETGDCTKCTWFLFLLRIYNLLLSSIKTRTDTQQSEVCFTG
jgi:hypothetical protein